MNLSGVDQDMKRWISMKTAIKIDEDKFMNLKILIECSYIKTSFFS